jgi:hypothetical protein
MLQICLGGCPDDMEVEVHSGVPLVAKTVADLRALNAVGRAQRGSQKNRGAKYSANAGNCRRDDVRLPRCGRGAFLVSKRMLP